MDVGQLLGAVIGVYFLLLGGFAAISTAQALEEEDREGLAQRIFFSLTKTTVFLGFPALLGVLIFINSDVPGSGGGGIMSKNMGLFVLFLFGGLGLVGLWIAAITIGFVASRLVLHLRPTVAATVIFGMLMGAPLLMALTSAVTAAQQPRAHRR